jgi:hypothetical protein
MARTVDQSGRIEVEWHLDNVGVVDGDYIAAHGHELKDATSLRVSPATFEDEETLRRILVPSLDRIDFSFFEVEPVLGNPFHKSRPATNRALRLFAELPLLRHLDLAWSYCIDDSGADALALLTGLHYLAIECDITDIGLSKLATLNQLRVFGFECSSHFTGSGFSDWGTMSHLRALALGQSTSVGQHALRVVANAPMLDYLNLNSCMGLTREGLCGMIGGPKLECIMIYGVPLDVETLRAIKRNNPLARINCDEEQFPIAERVEARRVLSER